MASSIYICRFPPLSVERACGAPLRSCCPQPPFNAALVHECTAEGRAQQICENHPGCTNACSAPPAPVTKQHSGQLSHGISFLSSEHRTRRRCVGWNGKSDPCMSKTRIIASEIRADSEGLLRKTEKSFLLITEVRYSN